MYNEPQLYGFLSLTLVSIAFFNFSGVSITKYMSATTRKVLDTLRTMVIWLAQMFLHFADERWDMPSFKDQFWLQLSGKDSYYISFKFSERKLGLYRRDDSLNNLSMILSHRFHLRGDGNLPLQRRAHYAIHKKEEREAKC